MTTSANKFTFSFDFDDTLGKSEILQEYCKKFLDQGHTVKILTRRYAKGITKEDEHTWVYLLAKELNIPSEHIHFTNRKLKYEFIDNLGINFHIDDDFNDYYYILNYTKCVPILFVEADNKYGAANINWQNTMDNLLIGILPEKNVKKA